MPQTNEANSQVTVLGLLGAMGALFGLAGTRRKRQF
ncbi:LPXTG cell wall anchor domain-containing protein [Pediococcus parvulus]|nr:LPXTG cell wall anchor domain-containing protein [Pediococcus parvulus]